MVVIPGLPPELATVPPAPASPDDSEADQKRAAWRAWRYRVQVYRAERHRDVAGDPGLVPFERARCAADPAYWMAIWLRVFEPRQRDAGYGYLPFIPFADQVRVLNELRACLTHDDERADAVWSKCRGWGASWLGCVLALWGWVFSQDWPGAPPWNVLMLSRKEELVDSKLQRSLFWKIDRLMRDLPAWQTPKGWNPDHHRQKGLILNPENGNEIGGESTNTKAGRGDRNTWTWLDEFQAMPNGLAIWSTIAETTDHRFACGTENLDEGTHHYNLGIGRHAAELGIEAFPHLIEADWWQNPLNDDAWFDRQKLRNAGDPDSFNREILRNPHAGISTWVYPWAYAVHPDPERRPVSGYAAYVAVDPGYRDPTALLAVQVTPDDEIVVLDAYAVEGKEADYFAPLLKPELFRAVEPNWQEKPFLVWQSTHGDGAVFEYDDRALAFARTVAAMGKPTYVGDTYGETLVGATKDSVYSRWRKYGIAINADRKTGDAVTRTVKMGRTFAGRREAMNERASRLRFATTPGARMCLKALKENKYKPRGDRPTQNEPREPLHDWTSHYVTALEYLAVRLGHRRVVLTRELAKPSKARLGQLANFGSKRGVAPVRSTLRGVS